MKTRAAIALALLAPACTGNSVASSLDASTAGDASPAPDATADDAAPTGDAAAADAGAVPDGACNTLTLDGLPLVMETASTDTPPPPLGGEVTDGRYVTKAVVRYEQPEAGATGNQYAGVLVISGGVTHLEALFPGIVQQSDGGADPSLAPITGTDDLVPPTSASGLLQHLAKCRNGLNIKASPDTWTYTVTGADLTLVPGHDVDLVITFEKQ